MLLFMGKRSTADNGSSAPSCRVMPSQQLFHCSVSTSPHRILSIYRLAVELRAINIDSHQMKLKVKDLP